VSAGKHWCWVFWHFDVQTVEFARTSEVLVRAWDSSMNTQPSHLTWNLMGMMNNCHFRIKLHQHVDQQVGGGGGRKGLFGQGMAACCCYSMNWHVLGF
jgi:nitrate reductase (NAD(P)H)